MKKRSNKILRIILKFLAQKTLKKYRPGIIGVTGSVGKTSSKLAIADALSSERNVRAIRANFNNELGFPLAILGNYQKIGYPIIFWPKVIAAGIIKLIFKFPYPDILVLEYGADNPGDIKYLLDIAKPNIGVITAIGDIPAHVEFFSSPEELAKEKSRLIEAVGVNGFAVLNADDETVMSLKNKTRSHIMTFGFGDRADVRIINFENRFDDDWRGILFKLAYNGSVVPIKINGALGKSHAYAAAAAAACSLIFGINLVKISDALNKYQPLNGRMTLVRGVKDTWIIDDSYNASPLSMHAALDTLKTLEAKRKIAVLGDMLEIGKYSLEAHEKLGRLAYGIIDVLFTVGPRAKFIAGAAIDAGMKKDKVFIFDTADEAKLKVREIIKKGDIVLIKASHAIGIDKVVEEIKFV
ncbi:MAG: UDP-N-acetylmuramoyl-tripeptide--D-alanyl-D-alanine ligase [Patescibacteria group bacterium]|nr:UDP-N-acetylmuramoyl-tripeptide--D-alanyl-D-alanine ligase [Patescibacteria group bacterium]